MIKLRMVLPVLALALAGVGMSGVSVSPAEAAGMLMVRTTPVARVAPAPRITRSRTPSVLRGQATYRGSRAADARPFDGIPTAHYAAIWVALSASNPAQAAEPADDPSGIGLEARDPGALATYGVQGDVSSLDTSVFLILGFGLLSATLVVAALIAEISPRHY